MTDLEKMKRWLDLCPYLQADALYTDTTLAVPANAGLYPMGQEILRQKEDVLGIRKADCRDTFLLRCVLPEGEKAAQLLMKIQNWVFSQNARGITPGFGSRETVRAEKGRLEKATQVGTALYVLTLTAEFEKEYEGEE